MVERGGAFTAAVIVAALLAGCGGGSPSRAHLPAADPSTALRPRTVDQAVFTVDCTYSHRAPDDPIVHPGRPGASHSHDFFGNAATGASSTLPSLLHQPTTCEDKGDTAAYWVPTLSRGSAPVDPAVLRAYYRAVPGTDVGQVAAPPAGLAMLVGDAHAPPGFLPPASQVGWGCGFRPRQVKAVPPGDCTVNSPLTLRLVFADCWDGRRTDAPDHRAHVAYRRAGRCPSAQPNPILQVQVSIQYPVWGSTRGLRLSSGGWQTAHGDFLNAWDQARLQHQTDLCIRTLANCTIG